MRIRKAIPTLWRFGSAASRHAQKATSLRQRPEFSQVNRIVGSEPVRPELSGLRLRRAGTPRRLAQLLITLAYHWHPSPEYRRRQAEIHRTNRWLRWRQPDARTLPPILSYIEDTDVAPTRLRPFPTEGSPFSLTELPRDLSDLAQAEKLRVAPTIRPKLTEPDAEYLVRYRALLPRRYRQFLRFSPYPRLVVVLASVTVAAAGTVWLTQLQRAEALAASEMHVARSAFRKEVDMAATYGVNPAALRLVLAEARGLETRSVPLGILPNGARVRYYRGQRLGYRALLARVRRLELHAHRYWTWKEAVTYAALVRATQAIHGFGLPVIAPAAAACRTPRCARQAVARQLARLSWLRETVTTLRVYNRAASSGAGPVGAAAREVQAVHTLGQIVPRAQLPMPIAEVDAAYARATSSADEARIAALSHLDVDALQRSLVRTLPAHAIVVSTENETLALYDRGHAVYRTSVTAGPSTPTGIFHIQARQTSLPAIFWAHRGRYISYRYGSLPNLLPFDGGAALQGAPWRTAFGPGSNALTPISAPATPRSVDLPPAAAATVFRWAQVGTEVVIW